MKYIMFLFLPVVLTLSLGCAHNNSKKCSATVRHSPTEYDICIDPSMAQEGQRIAFYKKKCTTASRGTPKKCRKEKVGEGVVQKNLDEHLSTIKLDENFEILESYTVEKVN